MPRPKRYFPVSQNINDDEEVWELTDRYGDRALRFWLAILEILDRRENHWAVSDQALATLARKVRLTPRTCSGMIGWMLTKGWLIVHGPSTDGPSTIGGPLTDGPRTIDGLLTNDSPMVVGARNYSKYHATKVQNTIPSEPSDPTDPILPKKEKEKKEISCSGSHPNGVWLEGEQLLGFLNQRTGKKFQARTPAQEPTKNLDQVVALLKAGYTTQQIRQVIANRWLKWAKDEKMQEYLRPTTLFRRSNFENYLGEIGKDAMPKL